MTSPLALAATQPLRRLSPGEVLLTQGSSGGELYVLSSGKLAVERDGVALATIDEIGALIGEMSVLLGSPSSATVRAEGPAEVHVIPDALDQLNADAKLAVAVGASLARRLDATSALVAELGHRQPHGEFRQLLGTIFASIHLPAKDPEYAEIQRADLFGHAE